MRIGMHLGPFYASTRVGGGPSRSLRRELKEIRDDMAQARESRKFANRRETPARKKIRRENAREIDQLVRQHRADGTIT